MLQFVAENRVLLLSNTYLGRDLTGNKIAFYLLVAASFKTEERPVSAVLMGFLVT